MTQIEYIVSILADESSLRIQVEEKLSGDLWSNEFASEYVEEIASKTGNYKKYGVFLKMLLSAVTMSSESVFLDILSSTDLEILKSRKNPIKPQSSQPPPPPQ